MEDKLVVGKVVLGDTTNDSLRVELDRAQRWGETLRELNVQLEDRMDLKERKIAHLEDDLMQTRGELKTCRELLDAKRATIADLRHQITDLMADLANARRILACGITDVQKSIGVGND